MTDGLSALSLSLKLAAVTTAILLVLATPLAWWLAQTGSRLKSPVQALVALPIVLPPTVLGFYLLVLFGPAAGLGRWWFELTGSTLSFSFSGLVIASCLYSLPFAVQPLQTAFEPLGRQPIETAQTLGASRLDAFFSVVVPQCRGGFLAATILSFAHTVGEFGVVLMVGGNIPGETRVVSIAIYDSVEQLDYATAHRLSATLLVGAFLVLMLMYLFNRPVRR